MLSLSELKLRPMVEEDLELVLKWRNLKDVRRYMLNAHIISLAEHREWYKRMKKKSNCELLMAVFQDSPVGVITIMDIKRSDKTCTWGMYIGEDMRNIGIGVLMEIHAIDRIVNHHKIRKIWGETLESNNRLILMHKRFGFEVEGIFKKHVYREGRYEDVIRTALFTDRWNEIRKEMIKTLRLNEE